LIIFEKVDSFSAVFGSVTKVSKDGEAYTYSLPKAVSLTGKAVSVGDGAPLHPCFFKPTTQDTLIRDRYT
jgi:hypothetical protein